MLFDLNTLWFLIVGGLFAGYSVLDGFDLGVGAIHLFHSSDEHRRLSLNAIGPVWDGNEVWLVTGGGALFAAFPEVYASVFSGFYLEFMFLLLALIFRAVAIEFRSKVKKDWWRKGWDIAFSLGSLGTAMAIGIILGNIAWGVSLDPEGNFQGDLLQPLHPYALLMGITTVALFSMHGSIYLVLKTEGSMQESARRLIQPTMIFFILAYAVLTMATLLYIPTITDRFRESPVFLLPAVLSILAIANIPREIAHGREFRAFLSSSVTMMLLMGLFAIGLYPNIVHSPSNTDHSLTIYTAASSQKTLGNMTIIAAIGVPIVTAYTVSVYWIFRGKVKLTPESY